MESPSDFGTPQCSTISPPPQQKPTLRFKAAFALLCIINLVCAIDATILSAKLAIILSLPAHSTFWLGTSFLLTSTVIQPLFTTLSHLITRKSILLLSILLFTLGTLLCSLSHSFALLLTGRCIQGLGGGGIVALTYVIVSDMVTLRERGKWFGIISLMWAIGAAVGPVMGGAFVDASEEGWRWIFWVNLPFCGIGLLRQLDWVGSFLFVAGLTSLLVPLTWGGIIYPWSSPRTVIPLCYGAAGILAFVLHSKYIAKHPLIRGSIFGRVTGSVSYIGAIFHGMIIWSTLYYMPLYFEVIKGYTPLKTGIALFPFTFTQGPAAIIVSFVIAKTGRYRPSLWVGWLLAAIGTSCLAFLTPDIRTRDWITLCLIPGVGYGILYPSMSYAVQAPSSDSDLPFAAAMYSFFRSLGQTLGVAIGGVMFQNSFKQQIENDRVLRRYGKADEWSRHASSLVEVVREDGKERLVKAYAGALQILWVLMGTLAFVAAMSAWVLTEEINLERELVTEQGFKYGEKKSGDVEKGRVVAKSASVEGDVVIGKVDMEGDISDERPVKE